MNKILEFFSKDKLVVDLMIVVIVITGIFSFRNLNREIFPETGMSRMSVRITYPGASAEDVELNALIPVENVIKNINGVIDYVSTTRDGSATISLTLDEDSKNLQAIKDEIFRQVNVASISGLPSDVDKISIIEWNPRLKSIFRVALVAKDDTATREDLFAISDVLQNMLGKVEGVNNVNRIGYRDKHVYLDVDPDLIQQKHVSISEIVSAIQRRNVRASSGTMQSIDRTENILTIGEFSDPMEVEKVIVRTGFEQGVVRVEDVANVSHEYARSGLVYLADGFQTIIFTIQKNENADIIRTVDNIREFMQNNKNLYDDKYEFVVLMDDSVSIKSLLNVIVKNAIIGFILVIIVLKLFLDFKTSFWTAFSIPICLLMLAIYMRLTNMTINVISLGAIITILGMLVDDAIIIAETIYVKKEFGLSPSEAAIQGVKEVFAPVTITILSTIIAFLPMLYISGMMGRFIYVFPIVIAVTLLASLFEATFMLPNHLAHTKTKRLRTKAWFNRIRAKYEVILKIAIKKRYFVLSGFILLFVLSVSLSTSNLRNFRLMRSGTSDEILINLKTTPGMQIDDTEKLVVRFEKEIRKLFEKNELVSIMSTVGRHAASRLEDDAEHLASMEIKLSPATNRKRETREIIKELRKEVKGKKYQYFEEIVFVERRKGPATANAIDIKVMTNDESIMTNVVQEIETLMTEVRGIKDISNELDDGKDEVRIRFNYLRLAQLGLDVATVATTVRSAFQGTTVTSVQTPSSKIDYRLQIEESHKRNDNFLMNLLIPNRSGNLIRLREVAYLERGLAKTVIRHHNGERTISVTADIDETTTATKANLELQRLLEDIPSKYPGVTLKFDGEYKQTQTALSELAIVFIVALMMIYLLVLLLFRSVGQPLIVMSVVPFGLIGVLLAFFVHGVSLDFMGLIGVIGLSGVVINDSLIMVDFINKVRKKDSVAKMENIVEKIAEGAGARLRPIILTTVTTVAGLMPSVYGIGGNVETFQTTVMAMAYGLLFATLLTLIFVPSLYMIGIDVKYKLIPALLKPLKRHAIAN